MKSAYNNRILSGLLMLLMAALWVSCSEDTIGTEANGGKLSSVTFHLGGIESLHTRAAGGTENFDSNKYKAKLYLFKDEREGSSTDPNNPYPDFKLDRAPVEIKEGYVTIDNLDRDKYNYIYIIVAYEDDYEEDAKVMCWDADSNGGVDIVSEEDDPENASLYTTCYIAALDGDNYNAPYTQKGEEPFMIYGAGGEIASQLSQFIPVEVILTRQMGAVFFSTGADDIESIQATCTITTDYYHLYLSQMIETVSGTQNHCSDYASGNSFAEITVVFTGGTYINDLKGYMLYLPCTTTKEYIPEYGNIPNNERINYQSNITDGSSAPSTGETSIAFQNKTYSTSELFPIYPNRRTILTIGDGSRINVSFGDNEGKIDQEGDWNGGL